MVDWRGSEFIDVFDVIHGLLVELFVVEESSACVVCELAQEVFSLVGGARGLVVGVRVGCDIVFVVVGAEALPWGCRLGGCDVFAVSGGVPLLLGSVRYIMYEVWYTLYEF